jgi:nitroimidazol reductase NimA-like FMN-containing flavoprotein (pyridoxamine 5'-phosphate oxidase superfamily)
MTTELHHVRRMPERGSHDPGLIRSILAAGQVCHVGLIEGESPVVIPTAYGVLENEIVVHGLPASRLLGTMRAGNRVCVTVTLFDGLVLARSAFEHSMNYRSVVVFGQARWIRDEDEKLAALRAISEQALPGRWDDVRPPDLSELRRTHVLAVPLAQASAKVRSGPPSPDDDDWDTWTGVLPAGRHWGEPVPEPGREQAEIPSYVATASSGRNPIT